MTMPVELSPLLSIAGIFQGENQPENNLLFAFFDAERNGIAGSKAFYAIRGGGYQQN